MKTLRISRPSWKRESFQKFRDIPPEGTARLKAARDVILAAVDEQVRTYFADPQLLSDSLEDFPSSLRLTGEYYIGDEYYAIAPDTKGFIISIMARCLAHPVASQSDTDDYLGLEIWLETDMACEQLSVYRNTDSSVI